jgi:hypothetical protein
VIGYKRGFPTTNKNAPVTASLSPLARRRFLQSLGAGAFAPFALQPAWAQPAPAGHAPWRLLVNEAVTGETNSFVLTNRYRAMADALLVPAKVKEITVEPVVDIKRFLALAQAEHKPELVFGKSVNQLAKLVRDHGFQPIVRRADPYKAAFIVGKDSPIKTLAQVGAATIVMPDEYAASSAVARAELRQQKLTQAKIQHVKYQEMVAMEIKSGMGQVGVVNPTVAKKWAEEGGRVIAETQPVVNWSLLAGPKVPPAVVEKLRETMMAMNANSAVMSQLGVKAWALADRKDYLDLLAYTQE